MALYYVTHVICSEGFWGDPFLLCCHSHCRKKTTLSTEPNRTDCWRHLPTGVLWPLTWLKIVCFLHLSVQQQHTPSADISSSLFSLGSPSRELVCIMEIPYYSQLYSWFYKLYLFSTCEGGAHARAHKWKLWELNPRRQVWWQLPLPTELPLQPYIPVLYSCIFQGQLWLKNRPDVGGILMYRCLCQCSALKRHCDQSSLPPHTPWFSYLGFSV